MSERKLEDFGEHIAGAKKEIYFKAIDPTSEETKSLPLSKLWSDKDIKAIDDIQISAIAHTLKTSLPNKPRQEHKLERWLNKLHTHQKTVVELIEKNNPVHTQSVLKTMQQGEKAYLLTQLDRADWKRIGKISLYQHTNENNAILNIQIDKQIHSFDSKNPVFLQGLNSKVLIDEFVNDIKTKLQEREKSKNSLTADSFDIYTRRSDDTAFICYKNDRQKTPLVNFETLAEARAYKNDPESIAKLGELWTAHRNHNAINKADMRNNTNEERMGKSYRDHDITPDEFMATFGVRGGQFGNWVTGDERQQMLNASYDGFMDLAKTLKIDPKAIGLNGQLAIAFGARGSGATSAHYEPNEKVINLTKTRGAGSLAHEWWHALDHYMKDGDSLLTKQLRPDSTARHNELITPISELVKTIHKSQLYSRSQTADAYRSPPYFSTDVEMTARAFESHVQHELSKIGIKNDFLVNIKAEKDWQKNVDAYPYPKADELKLLSKAYNTVFDTLKEVDKEFISTQYEPESILHADTLAVNGSDKTKEKQSFTLDNHLEQEQEQEKNQEIISQQPRPTPLAPEETTEQKKQVLLSATNKILINNFLEKNGFEKGINVGSYRKQIDNNRLLVVDIANDVSIQRIENNQIKGREIVLPNLSQNLGKDNIKQAFSQSTLWQTGKSAPNISQYNTKLNCPYQEKNQAKALGAKWDSYNKTWYVPAGLDLNQFSRWLTDDKNKKIEPKDKNQERIYLYTSFKDLDNLKNLKNQGVVKFDNQHKVWYAKPEDANKVSQWITRPHIPTPETAFAEHLRTSGISIAVGHPIADGRPHRLSNEGSKDKNVMYQLYPNHNGVPAGHITNFSRGGVTEKWIYPIEHLNILKNIEAVERAKGSNYNRTTNTTTLSPPNQNIHPNNITTPSTKPDIEQSHNKAAERAKMVMSFAPVVHQHEYLSRKQVTSNNLLRVVPDKSQLPPQFANEIIIANNWREAQAMRQNNPSGKMILQKGNLIIPQFNDKGELRAFETIGYNGAKYALQGGEKNGLSTTLGKVKNGEPIILTEGYATGATLHEQTGRTVIVAFGKGGLMSVAANLRKHCPDSKIYIGADNDHNKPLETNPMTGKPKENVGLVNAQKVADKVPNVHILVPQFNVGDKGKDWNDIYVDKGIDELKRQLKEQLYHINPPKEKSQSIQPKDLLDIAIIKQNYPTMSNENLQSIQQWKERIKTNFSPEAQNDLFKRLEAKLPNYAKGERLIPPKSQQEMGKSISQVEQPSNRTNPSVDKGGR